MPDLEMLKAEKRSWRAGLAPHLSRTPKRHGMRRGTLDTDNTPWRRCAMGTNHIACFGVWRRGTRRQAERANRAGITRWHKPHREARVLSAAIDDAVNQD
jgi:hypothetical protein